MKEAAAYAIAECVSDDELSPDMIIPNSFNKEVAIKVAEAVKAVAIKEGVCKEYELYPRTLP